MITLCMLSQNAIVAKEVVGHSLLTHSLAAYDGSYAQCTSCMCYSIERERERE